MAKSPIGTPLYTHTHIRALGANRKCYPNARRRAELANERRTKDVVRALAAPKPKAPKTWKIACARSKSVYPLALSPSPFCQRAHFTSLVSRLLALSLSLYMLVSSGSFTLVVVVVLSRHFVSTCVAWQFLTCAPSYLYS